MSQRKSSLVGKLLVSILLLLILAVFVIPSLIPGHNRIYANEYDAVLNLHDIQSAQLKYAQTYPAVGFADRLAKLGPPPAGMQPDANHANLLSVLLTCPTEPCITAGYSLAMDQTSGTPVTSFRITAVPETPGRTGYRGFCATGLGKISADPEGGKNCSLPLASDD